MTAVEDEKLTAEMTVRRHPHCMTHRPLLVLVASTPCSVVQVEARHLNYMGGLHGGVSATVRPPSTSTSTPHAPQPTRRMASDGH